MENNEAPYAEYRAQLVERHAESGRSFDKAVAALSGGALVLSIAFVRDVVPKPDDPHILALSWGALALSLAANLVSFFLAERDYYHSIHLLDTDYEAERFPHDLTASRFEKWVPKTNMAALYFFLVGLGLMVWFAIVNL